VELELRHLRIVVAIADAGSVTKAAASLGLAQPALTTQLQRIERTLGGPLFVRDRRGVQPTALGDLVLARARLLIPAMSGLHVDAGELIGAASQGRYRIGASSGPITSGLMQRLTEAHAEGQVQLHSSWSQLEVVRMTGEGRLDYALLGTCANDNLGGGLAWRTISVDAVWVLVHEGHPLAGRPEIGLGELAGDQWVGAPGDGCFRDCFMAACASAGFTPRVPYDLDASGVFDLVASGRAVAIAQGPARPMPGVVGVPVTGSPLGWKHVLGWDLDSPAARHADEVARLSAQAYRETLGQRPRYSAWLAGHPEFGLSAAAEHADGGRFPGGGDE
jgi:DNA-binding transcriptional LysR family regulator